jgi:hypothetical protein
MQVTDPERAIRTEEEILRKMEALAGVSAVAITSAIPLEGGSSNPVYAEDQSTPQGSIPPVRRFKFVSPGYFSAIGSRLIAGRDLTWTELYNRMPVALVSENMARELWHDPRAAVGKRIRSTLKDDWREVIGVVADLRDDGIDQKAPTIVYWPLLQKNFGAARKRDPQLGVYYPYTEGRIGGTAPGTPTGRRERESEFAGYGRQDSRVGLRPIARSCLFHAGAAGDCRRPWRCFWG